MVVVLSWNCTPHFGHVRLSSDPSSLHVLSKKYIESFHYFSSSGPSWNLTLKIKIVIIGLLWDRRRILGNVHTLRVQQPQLDLHR